MPASVATLACKLPNKEYTSREVEDSTAVAGSAEVRMAERGGWREADPRAGTTLPVVGLLGPERALEVTGHAALETID